MSHAVGRIRAQLAVASTFYVSQSGSDCIMDCTNDIRELVAEVTRLERRGEALFADRERVRAKRNELTRELCELKKCLRQQGRDLFQTAERQAAEEPANLPETPDPICADCRFVVNLEGCRERPRAEWKCGAYYARPKDNITGRYPMETCIVRNSHGECKQFVSEIAR